MQGCEFFFNRKRSQAGIVVFFERNILFLIGRASETLPICFRNASEMLPVCDLAIGTWRSAKTRNRRQLIASR
jgi:hypothetical protein